jgi:hypothetical protein
MSIKKQAIENAFREGFTAGVEWESKRDFYIPALDVMADQWGGLMEARTSEDR